MLYVEYDWTYNVYRLRLGDRWLLSYPDLKDVKVFLKTCGQKLGRKTDTRTWKVVSDAKKGLTKR